MATRNANLAWLGMQNCVSNENLDCNLRALEEQLLALDSQNSEAWMFAAVSRYRRDEPEAALAALRQAGVSPETRTYRIETIELLERALRTNPDMPFPDRAMLAWTTPPLTPYQPISTICREESARSSDWAHACLAYGQLLEAQSDGELGYRIGLSIQARAFEALGDLENGAQARARLDAARRSVLEFDPSERGDPLTLPFLDPVYFAAYWESVRRYGEIETRRIVREDPFAWMASVDPRFSVCAPR